MRKSIIDNTLRFNSITILPCSWKVVRNQFRTLSPNIWGPNRLSQVTKLIFRALFLIIFLFEIRMVTHLLCRFVAQKRPNLVFTRPILSQLAAGRRFLRFCCSCGPLSPDALTLWMNTEYDDSLRVIRVSLSDTCPSLKKSTNTTTKLLMGPPESLHSM